MSNFHHLLCRRVNRKGDSFIVFSGKPKLASLPVLSNSEFRRLSLLNILVNSRTCCPNSKPYLSISLVSSHASLVLTFAKMERIWMGRWSLSSHPLTAVWFKEKRREFVGLINHREERKDKKWKKNEVAKKLKGRAMEMAVNSFHFFMLLKLTPCRPPPSSSPLK
ncbi:hypothetical protein NE237_021918 [Protea cynaroides]|uniref:Uncharacterized protein n=1 Tax=Protea cynaroides TaxID=273540 RepID=A0A9Q0H9E7_9MAGN|nr:hypothetical protein NE237_021918 [Protea cynaroides]